jgi:TPR repeat protein
MKYWPYLLASLWFAASIPAQQLSEGERKQQASAWLDRAETAFQAKDYEAAAKGYARSLQFWVTDSAASNLCNLYLYGMGVPRDVDKAKALCEVGARLGDPNALTMLGEMYQNGNGLPQDREKALEYYRKAADLGHLHAQYALGYLMLQTDPDEATPWLRKAADAGYAPAKQALDAIERGSTSATKR